MTHAPAPLRAILSAGTIGSVLSAAALAVASAASGRGIWQPLNATSHWRHSDAAASRRTLDLAHTGVGAATHWAATVFWATGYEAWLRARPPRTRTGRLAIAVAVSAMAAFVDYRLTPRRFTPGWEFVLGRLGMGRAMRAWPWASWPDATSQARETRARSGDRSDHARRRHCGLDAAFNAGQLDAIAEHDEPDAPVMPEPPRRRVT